MLRVARVIEAFFLAAVVVLLIASTLLIANTIVSRSSRGDARSR